MSELLKSLIMLLASALFTWLIGKYPNFPLDQNSFVNFFIWLFIVLGVISGARLYFSNIRKSLQKY